MNKYYENVDAQFYAECHKELAKVNAFFSEKFAELERKLTNIEHSLVDYTVHPTKSAQYNLELDLKDFYLGLVLLQNFQILNYTGFKKILIKHDHYIPTASGEIWHTTYLDNAVFHTNKKVMDMLRRCEDIFTDYIENGNRLKAIKRLRVPAIKSERRPLVIFRGAFLMGAFAVVGLNILQHILETDIIDAGISLPLFRGPFLLVQALYLWSVNIYFWQNNGVNHVLIFRLNPRDHVTQEELFHTAAIFSLSWAVAVMGHFHNALLGIPRYLSGYLLYAFWLLYLFNPFKVFYYSARRWTRKYLKRVLFAPFYDVQFTDFWVADQMNSVIQLFMDLNFAICFMIEGEISPGKSECEDLTKFSYLIFALMPPSFRLSHCIRRFVSTKNNVHALNAMKYTSAILSTISWYCYLCSRASYSRFLLNPFFYIFVVVNFISSIALYTWDVIMDWGLFQDSRYLREELFYKEWLYYFAIVENFILRFIWMVLIPCKEFKLFTSRSLATAISPFDFFRRFIWNFFRLENEHLNNCGQFRKDVDINIRPLEEANSLDVVIEVIERDLIDAVMINISDNEKPYNRQNRQSWYIKSNAKTESLLLLDEHDEDL